MDEIWSGGGRGVYYGAGSGYRISCFDVILKNDVTKKGTVLTQMSRFWFDMTKDILPNHMISLLDEIWSGGGRGVYYGAGSGSYGHCKGK
mgnify:CR=1 FL=1